MAQWLTGLTLAYAAILVLALAVILATIVVLVRRIGAALDEVRDSLAEACERTAALEDLLGPLDSDAAELRGDVEAAAADLERVEERLTSRVRPRAVGREPA